MLTTISFNVNSIRQRQHQLEALVEKYSPDIIGLQETKVTDEDFPIDNINKLGYHVEFFGQKTHYGVALLSKMPFVNVKKGFSQDDPDAQRRFIVGEFESPFGENLIVMNGYFPQGESRDHATKFPNKESFYSNLLSTLNNDYSASQPLILMGDMNVAPLDIDIGIGEDNKKRWLKTGKCSFLPEEREWLKAVSDWGLRDTFRLISPEKEECYSWFDYRSRGFEREPKRGLRIDLIMSTDILNQRVKDSGIDYDIRGFEKPSDHCPIWTIFE